MAGELHICSGNGTSPDASISRKPPATSGARMGMYLSIIGHIFRHLHGSAVLDAQPCALITLKEAVWLAELPTPYTYPVPMTSSAAIDSVHLTPLEGPLRNLGCYLEISGSKSDQLFLYLAT